jgi:hypothetical protein
MLEIYGDLTGGSPFKATVAGDIIRFETEAPNHEFIIRWEGHLSGDFIRGTYLVYRNGDPLGDFSPASEEGKWTCKLATDVHSPILHGNN